MTARLTYSLWLALVACLACAEPKTLPATSAPASAPASSMPADAPLLAPLGEGMGSELRGLLGLGPERAEFALLLDVQRLWKGPLWKEYATALERGIRYRPLYVDLEKATGFDPFRDVRGAALFLTDLSRRPSPGVLVLRARFDTKRLGGYLTKARATEVRGVSILKNGMGLALGPELIYLGDPSIVEAAVQRANKGEAGPLGELGRSLDPGRPLSVAFRLGTGARAVMGLPVALDPLEGVAGWLDLSAGLEAKLLLQFEDATSARLFREDLDRTWPGYAKKLEKNGTPYLRTLRWEQRERELSFSLSLPAPEAIEFVFGPLAFGLLQGFLTLAAAQEPESPPESAPGTQASTAPSRPPPL